jgi:hypothetical protein
MNESSSITDKIKKYIATEKALSKSNIKKLEIINKRYSVRLIKKELLFIHFDFSKVKFDDLDDCRFGIKLFKLSKSEFLKKHTNETVDLQKIFLKIKKYADNLDIIEGKVDGYYFPSLSGKEITKDDGSIKKIFLKRIMFLRFLLYSSALSCLEGFDTVGLIVDNVFKYVVFTKEPLKFFDKLENQLLEIQLRKYKNVSLKAKDIIKKTKDTYILIFDIDRVGNEKVNSLYVDLKNKRGEKVWVKKKSMFNYPVKNKYYKSLKIKGGDIDDISELDKEESLIICNFSRREMEFNQENIVWLKFTLDKIING